MESLKKQIALIEEDRKNDEELLDSFYNDLQSIINEQGESLKKLKLIAPFSFKCFDIELIKLSQEVFGLMMRGHFRKNEDDKFQPCQDEIDFLKSSWKGSLLCAFLRYKSTPEHFYKALYPGGGEDDLERTDSIFHLHQESVKKDIEEFEDLTKRAEKIIEVVLTKYEENRNQNNPSNQLEISLSDGHGRMLVCLLKALYDKRLLDVIDGIKIYEISPVVHEYHNLVFPHCVQKIPASNIRGLSPHYEYDIQEGSTIYLNFYSIPSSDNFGWTAHFQGQNIDNWVPGCSKENVLKLLGYHWQGIKIRRYLYD